MSEAQNSSKDDNVCSVARLDDPKILRRKLQDNVGRYKVDAVGVINHTHRFRGLADFYWDMNTSSFAKRYVDQVLPGNGACFGFTRRLCHALLLTLFS